MKSLFVMLGILMVSNISTAQTRICSVGTNNVMTLIEIQNETHKELQKLLLAASKPNLKDEDISVIELKKGLAMSEYIKCDAAIGYALRAIRNH